MNGPCDNCAYMGRCDFGQIGAERCRVTVIQECKQIKGLNGFRDLQDALLCRSDISTTNQTAKGLFELIAKINYNAGLEEPNWFRRG